MYTSGPTLIFLCLLCMGTCTFSKAASIATHSPTVNAMPTRYMAKQVKVTLNCLHAAANKAHYFYVQAQNIHGSSPLPPLDVLSLMVTGPQPLLVWAQLPPSKIFTNCIGTLKTIVSALRPIKAEESSRAQQTGNVNDKKSAQALFELDNWLRSSYFVLEIQANATNISFDNTTKIFNMQKMNQITLDAMGKKQVSSTRPMKTIRNYAILDMLQHIIRNFTQVCQVKVGSN